VEAIKAAPLANKRKAVATAILVVETDDVSVIVFIR
jgi:hypothetical protein